MIYVLLEIIRAVWILMPAYVSNVFASLRRGRVAMDAGRHFMGRRLLGDGKTAEGFVTGFLSGFAMAALQAIIQTELPRYMRVFSTETALLIPLLAVLGDCLGSFIKRRLGMERGEMAMFLDQLDFVALPLLYLLATGSIPLVTVLVGLSITVPVHMLINILAYRSGVKREPW